MSGIAGIYSMQKYDVFEGHDISLENMMETLRHRGPDGAGCFSEFPVKLGHRRLSITDISAGNQPIQDNSGRYVICMDGVIYNRAELKAAFGPSAHNSDVEVLLSAYMKWGEACLNRVSGAYAFAVYDRKEKCLFIARDKFGQKPVYYSVNKNVFLFASEPKAIISYEPDLKKLRHESVVELIYKKYVYAPHTIFKDILKLRPGHYIKVRPEGVEEKMYWSIEKLPAENKCVDFDENVKNIGDEVEEAVKNCLRSDVDFGIFLSGGLDSSLMLALVHKCLGKPIQTISIGFNTEFSELKYARKVSQLFNTRHHEVHITEDDYISNILRVMRHNLLPVQMPADIPTYILSREASKFAKMVLSGECADGVFGGSTKFVYDRISKRLSLLRSISKWLPHQKFRKLVELNENPTLFKRTVAWSANFNNPMVFGRILKPDIAKTIGLEAFPGETEYISQFTGRIHDVEKMMCIDIKYWLADNLLERSDRLSMAHSLELRTPFIDEKIVSRCFEIPIAHKIKRFDKKVILKKIAEQYLSRDIVYRKKQGFTGNSIGIMFRRDLKSILMDSLTNKSAEIYNYVDHNEVQHLISLHMKGTHEYGAVLWTLMNTQLFLREHA